MDRKQKRILCALPVLLIVISLLSLCFGWYGSNVFESAQGLHIVSVLRLPRLLGALLAGSALAVSGALVQSVLHNSLASANLIGINSGCGFFSLLAAILFPSSYLAGILSGFAGGLLCASMIAGLMLWKHPSRLTVLLSGLAISQFFSAGIDFLLTVDSDLAGSYISYKVGSLSSMSMANVIRASWIIVPALIIALLCSRQLSLFSFTSAQAQALGLNVPLWTALFLSLAALLGAGVVSFCGLMGFAGLIVPAFLKKLHLPAFWYLLACVMAGAVLVAAADLTGRIIVMPWELPAGLVLSLLGGPFFLYLLFERKKENA